MPELSTAEFPIPSNDSAQQPLPTHLHVLDISVSILVRQPTLHFVLLTPYTLHRVLNLSDKHRLSLPAATPLRLLSGRHTPADKKWQATVARSKNKRHHYFTTRHEAILECPL